VMVTKDNTYGTQFLLYLKTERIKKNNKKTFLLQRAWW